jgi:beta-glucanase (GH16 family)
VLTGSASNQELEDYTRARTNVSIDGHGHLAITARRQNTSAAGREWHYTSGKLETPFAIKYGRIAARIKVPAGPGLWPAFWMLGANYAKVGWPDSGELDILEMQGSRPHRLVATVHGPATGSTTLFQVNRFYHSSAPLNDAFHVFAIDWTRNRIVWSIDGHPYGTISRRDLKPGQEWVFNRPYLLYLNLAVGGYWVGPPTARTHFPARMLVDWVRVYSS